MGSTDVNYAILAPSLVEVDKADSRPTTAFQIVASSCILTFTPMSSHSFNCHQLRRIRTDVYPSVNHGDQLTTRDTRISYFSREL